MISEKQVHECIENLVCVNTSWGDVVGHARRHLSVHKLQDKFDITQASPNTHIDQLIDFINDKFKENEATNDSIKQWIESYLLDSNEVDDLVDLATECLTVEEEEQIDLCTKSSTYAYHYIINKDYRYQDLIQEQVANDFQCQSISDAVGKLLDLPEDDYFKKQCQEFLDEYNEAWVEAINSM